MNFPVFDLHCDTVSNLVADGHRHVSDLRSNQLHIDLLRGKTLPGYAQCFAFFTTTMFPMLRRGTVQDFFWQEVSALQDAIDKNRDIVRQARTSAEVQHNLKDGKMSIIFTLEGPAGIGFDPAKLEKLSQLGFCISTLGWNEKNELCGSHKTGGGLTSRGREYVKEAQRLGIAVDVSHISDEAFWQIMDMSQAPVIASHSNSRSVWNISRNLTDEMFLEICKTGGVAGLNQYADFLGKNATIDTACDHIFHFMELDPEGDHISLGGDLDGCDALPVGFEGVQDYPKLALRLLERGLNQHIVHKIFWDNALRVLDVCQK